MFFRRKLGKDQKKGLRRKLGEDQKKRSSPKAEVFFRRKLDEDKKKTSSPKPEVFFLLNHYSRGIWCYIRPNFVGLFTFLTLHCYFLFLTLRVIVLVSIRCYCSGQK